MSTKAITRSDGRAVERDVQIHLKMKFRDVRTWLSATAWMLSEILPRWLQAQFATALLIVIVFSVLQRLGFITVPN